MGGNNMTKFKSLLLPTACLALIMPSAGWACACGCGVFQVGTGTMFPTGSGGKVWLEYDFMDQNKNWHGTSSAPLADNDDKKIKTDFFTAGVQYMFNRKWGIEAELPYWNREFTTTTDDPNPGDTGTFTHADIGDMRIRGVYSGFSDDMSTGVSFGLKLASGNFTYPNFDRDTSIGTGSTDVLLGAYHMGNLVQGTADRAPVVWYVNGQVDRAVITQDGYRPGDEFDGALGAYYGGIPVGKSGTLSPLLQLIGSVRAHDSGVNADPDNSGYTRLLISPGIEYDVNRIKLYGDIEVPVYQDMKGNQLISPVAVKLIASYNI
jgi:hypothetical protein